MRRVDVDAGATHRVVRDYLAHYGYADTLAAFDAVAGLEDAPAPASARCAPQRPSRKPASAGLATRCPLKSTRI